MLRVRDDGRASGLVSSLMERIFGLHQGVVNSPELDRIIALPRRTLDLNNVPDLTPVFRRPGGTLSLKPIQSAALLELETVRGGFFPIGVGYGKTLITLLAPSVLRSKKPVLLVPPRVKYQLLNVEMPRMALHFTLPAITVVSYSSLSTASGAHILEELEPDLIIADEAHFLRHKTSARTKRVVWYMRAHPDTRFVALSGTMIAKSIKDFAHLCEGALREGSPVPRKYQVLEEWSAALDDCDYPLAPGALTKLYSGPDDNVRAAFGRRLRETAGVVATSEGAIGTSLVISILKPKLPPVISEALSKFRATWEIGEEEYSDALSFARIAKQLALGFYYRWDWPNGRDDEWLEARSRWKREIRSYLAHSSRPGCDTELLYTNAVRNGTILSGSYLEWQAVAARPQPPTVTVWLDKEFVSNIVSDWISTGPVVIWYSHISVGNLLTDMGLMHYTANADITRPIVCSINADRTGLNLQSWSKNLFLCCPSSGEAWEQAIGRTHRLFQTADEVTVDVLLHTPELRDAWATSIQDAERAAQEMGTAQKILYATIVGG